MMQNVWRRHLAHEYAVGFVNIVGSCCQFLALTIWFGDSPGGLLALGLAWAAVCLNQWLFTTAALGEILSLSDHATRLLATILFLVMASLMLLLPIMLYLIGPGKAQGVLGKVDNWLSEAMPIVVIVILFAIGFYFIIDGILGVMNFQASQ